MPDTIESVTAMRKIKGHDYTQGAPSLAVHEIKGDRHTLIAEGGRVLKITFCNKCGSAFSIGTNCVTCACYSGG